MSQREHSTANKKAWSHKAYEAWHQLDGAPEELARVLRENPGHTLRDYKRYLGNVEGKNVANLLGSFGKKAVALSLLGAQVTVVDISEGNRRYALELAQSAGVGLDYVVADVLEWPTDALQGHFDLVFMEYGVLHYFVDLNPLAKLVHDILAPGGQWLLHEYHPILKKCAPDRDGRRLVVEGDYFSGEIIERPPPYGMAFSQAEVDEFPLCRIKYWQLGEIVSAVAANGLIIEHLDEIPHREHLTLPGMFTLVAKRGS